MADEKNPKPGLFAQTLAKAVDLWRILVGLSNSFLLWLDEGDRPRDPNKITQAKAPIITKAQWDVIAVFAAQLPLYGLKLLILTGLVINQCRSEVSGTLTADPLDGAALVSADLPQIGAYFYLAALWLFLEFLVILVKIIKPRIDVQVS